MQYPIPQACPWCHKPLRNALPFTLQQHGASYITVPLLNGVPVPPDQMCQGHVIVECDVCGWSIAEGYHSQEQCEQLRKVLGKTKKTVVEVPQVFYDAFDKEKW